MPAVPVLAAVGGAISTAAPIISAGAGIYSAVSGADAARKAAHAAQDQAKAAAGGGAQNVAGSGLVGQVGRAGNIIAKDYGNGLVQYQNGSLDNLNIARTSIGTYSRATGAGGTDAATGNTGANAIVPSSIAGPGGTVDLNAAQVAAQAIAQQNAASSQALEDQYNPGASDLRRQSLQQLLDALNAPRQGVEGTLPTVPGIGSAPVSVLNQRLLAQVASQAGQPLTGVGYDSPLTRAAIAKAQQDLALGGALPQDVAQLVARKSFANAGMLTGGRGLGNGRDISARDLGLTSLDLENQRLAQALQAGGAEANLEGANAAMRLAAQQYARNNLLQSQGATAADQGQQLQAYLQQQQLAQQRAAQEASNYFNQNSLLQSIASGQFARNLAGAQFGQNITPPASGLDPGSVVNLAVGNSNVAANAQQNANAAAATAANNKMQLGGQLLGSALGFAQGFFKPTAGTGLQAPSAPSASAYFSPSVFGGY